MRAKAPASSPRRENQALRDVSPAVVPDLVGQHRLEFRRRKLGDQRVEQDDAPEPAEAREKSIGMDRSPAAVHDLYRRGPESRPLAQRKEPLPQRPFRQGIQPVEKGHDEERIGDRHHHLKREDEGEAPQPPRRPGPPHDRQEHPQEGKADRKRQRQMLQLVGQPDAKARPVEAEPRLKPEILP